MCSATPTDGMRSWHRCSETWTRWCVRASVANRAWFCHLPLCVESRPLCVPNARVSSCRSAPCQRVHVDSSQREAIDESVRELRRQIQLSAEVSERALTLSRDAAAAAASVRDQSTATAAKVQSIADSTAAKIQSIADSTAALVSASTLASPAPALSPHHSGSASPRRKSRAVRCGAASACPPSPLLCASLSPHFSNQLPRHDR